MTIRADSLTTLELRSTSRLTFALALAIIPVLGTQRATAQPSAPNPVQLEVLGLQRWTLKMLEDSVRRRVPGQTLKDAACMVTLRDSLHFADASVEISSVSMGDGKPPTDYLIIKVIEPAESWRVRFAPAPHDSLNVLRPAYADVVVPVTDSLGGLGLGRIFWSLQFYHRDSVQRRGALDGGGPAGRDDALRLWKFLDYHKSDADRRTAMLALRQDGFFENRFVAAMVLSNFGDHDSTWLALTEALRDRAEPVRAAAATVLDGLPSRKVNWAPAAPTLRLLLGGTNILALDQVIRMLERTQVDPALAGTLLRKDGKWLLRELGASYPGGSSSAHALLVRLNAGRDLGTSQAAWSRWIATL